MPGADLAACREQSLGRDFRGSNQSSPAGLLWASYTFRVTSSSLPGSEVMTAFQRAVMTKVK